MGAMAALAALGLAACVNGDAGRSDVVNAMTDVDLPEDQAECIGDAFVGEPGSAGLDRVRAELDDFTGFDQAQLNTIAEADTTRELEELPDSDPGTIDAADIDAVRTILAVCTNGVVDTGDTGDGTDETDTDDDETGTTDEDDADG